MIAVSQRALLAGLVLCLASPWLSSACLAQEGGHVRLQGEMRGGFSAASEASNPLAALLPPGPASIAPNHARALNAYAPEQRVRLKQTNFTGDQ